VGLPPPIAIAIAAKPGLAKVASWSLELFDTSGAQVKGFEGSWPASRLEWDGALESGGQVEAASSYPAVLTVLDEYGNKGSYKGSFSVADIPGAEASSIAARRDGFSPTSVSAKKTLDLLLSVGSESSVEAWRVEVLGVDKGVAKTIRAFSGSGSNIPEFVQWDGMDDSGALCRQGSYYAALSVDYGKSFKPALVKSRNFSLVTTAPSGSITVDPPAVSISDIGPAKPIGLTIRAKSAFARIGDWIMSVYDPSGTSVVVFTGSWPDNKVAWDGRTVGGGSLIPNSRYKVLARVQDEYGNVGDLEGTAVIEGSGAATQPSSIEALSPGFSPTAAGKPSSIDFKLALGNSSSVQSWKVEILGPDGRAAKAFSDAGSRIPASLGWDGRGEKGELVPEGRYRAALSVDYGQTFKATQVVSRDFALVTSAPSGSISIDPPSVDLAELGPAKPVTFTIQAKSALARISSWNLSLSEPSGKPIIGFSETWPKNKVTWEGRTPEGAPILAGLRYAVSAEVRDEYGNVGKLAASLSTEGLAAATEPSSIHAGSAGFAPAGDGSSPDMRLALSVGNADALKSWKVDIADEGGTIRKSMTASSAFVPESLSWDGRTDAGDYAPEGRYSASLSLDYGYYFAPVKVSSEAFVLDLSPPRGAIALSTELFSPDGDGENDTIAIGLSGESELARIVGWSLTALDPGDNPFMSWKGLWPASQLQWDGRGKAGDIVESASDYALTLKLRDEFGNVGTVTKKLTTDILVSAAEGGYRIRISSIVFKPFTADYMDVSAELAARNIATLDLLASKLQRFPDYEIKLEGHAVMINWDNATKGRAEQEEILIPLSKARAEAIKAALAERGISAGRLVTSGVGAENPIVPDSDFPNRWKNRRVEFFILK
jgi:outer membrane protein OmpA-like peptidoglycan-associated protein/flagellar hook assembly protein FlgD